MLLAEELVGILEMVDPPVPLDQAAAAVAAVVPLLAMVLI
jgi:hypothetical protein